MIAIIIPYYKLTYFEATLQSLADQTDKRFKVYIGNDGSPEDPIKLIEKFKRLIDITYKKFDNNLGSISLVKQWERCIQLTNNEKWIIILGDDDVLGRNAVHEFYKNLVEIEQSQINVVRFATQCIDENAIASSKVFNNVQMLPALAAFENRLNGLSRASLSEHIFRKSVYNSVGFKNYKLAWHVDDMAWLEFTNFGFLYCINAAIVYIRISNISITGKNDQKDVKLASSFAFYNDLLTTYKSKLSKELVSLILRVYEGKLVQVEGKTLNVYIKMVKLYLINFNFINVCRFTYRFLFKS